MRSLVVAGSSISRRNRSADWRRSVLAYIMGEYRHPPRCLAPFLLTLGRFARAKPLPSDRFNLGGRQTSLSESPKTREMQPQSSRTPLLAREPQPRIVARFSLVSPRRHARRGRGRWRGAHFFSLGARAFAQAGHPAHGVAGNPDHGSGGRAISDRDSLRPRLSGRGRFMNSFSRLTSGNSIAPAPVARKRG